MKLQRTEQIANQQLILSQRLQNQQWDRDIFANFDMLRYNSAKLLIVRIFVAKLAIKICDP